MAAEKLTKARLLQIIVMLLVLITAFVWRTIDYSQVNTKCYLTEECNFTINNRNHFLTLLNDTENGFVYRIAIDKKITASVVDGNAKIERDYDKGWLKIVAHSAPITVKFTYDQEHRNVLINRRN